MNILLTDITEMEHALRLSLATIFDDACEAASFYSRIFKSIMIDKIVLSGQETHEIYDCSENDDGCWFEDMNGERYYCHKEL